MKKPRRRGFRRFVRRAILAGLIAVVLLVGGVALLGPRIAGALAPGVAGSLAGGKIAGDLTLSGVHLTWGGPQRIGVIELRDDRGAVIASGEVEASTSLLDTLLGSRDLGVVTLSGRADLPRVLASLNTKTVGKKSAGGEPGSSATTPATGAGARSLPRSLKAQLRLDGVTVVLADGSTGAKDTGGDSSVGLKNITGAIDFSTGVPISVAFNADSLTGAGSVTLTATITGVTDSSGALTPSKAVVESKISGTIAPETLDALTGALGLDAVNGLAGEITPGPVTFAVNYQGGLHAGRVALNASAVQTEQTPLLAQAKLNYADGRITLAEPATFSAPISQGVLDRLVGPEQAGRVTIDKPVGVTMTVASLDVPAPAGGPLDLRGASVRLGVKTTDAVGGIALVNASGDSATESDTFHLAPATFTIDAPDLAGPVATSATFRGASAGQVTLDLTADNLLDEAGAYRGGLPALRGDVAVVGAATDLLQPFVERLGIDLPQTLGASVDAKLQARAVGSSTKTRSGEAGATHLVFSLDTDRVSAHGQMSLDPSRIRTTGEGIVIKVQSAGAAFDSVFGALFPGAETKFTSAGSATVTIWDLALPLVDRSVRFDQARATVRMSDGGFSIQPGAQAPTIDVESLAFSFSLAPDEKTRAGLEATLANAGRSFEIKGGFSAPDLFDSDGSIDLAHAHLSGSARLSDVPTKMLALLAGLSNEDSELLAQSIGPTINATLSALPPVEGGPAWTTISVIASGKKALVLATLALTPGVEIRVADVTAGVVNPESATRILHRVAPELDNRTRFASPVRVSLRFNSFVIPLDSSGMPDIRTMAPVQATLKVKDDLLFTGVPVGGETTVGAGLRNVHGTATFDLAGDRNSHFEIQSELFDPRTPKQVVGLFSADAALTDGSLKAQARVEKIDTQRLDALLGEPDLFELSLGSPVAISLKTDRKSAADPMIVEVGVEAPRLAASALVRADSKSLTLVEPTTAQWTMDPRWASKYVTGSGSDGGELKLSVAGPTAMSLSIRRASIGADGKPMKPGVFDLDASASVPSLSLRSPGGVVTKYSDISARVASRPAPGAVEFHAKMTSEGAGQAPFNIAGRITQLADDSGALTPQRAAVTFQADGDLPTGLIDSLAQSGGLIAEAIGPVVKIQAESEQFSRDGGSLRARASSPRAQAAIAGRARDGAFFADGTPHVALTTITPKLGELLFHQIFPMIGVIQKQPGDEPATIDAAGLVLPTDGDMSKLSGRLEIKLGRVSYQASPFFAIILTATNNNPDAMLLADWPPLEVTIDHGVAKYNRVQLPIGNVAFDTQGEVDLVNQRANVIVYVPLFALMDRVTNVAARVPFVTSDTLIPIRMKGPLGKLKAEPAIDLLPNELFKHPENLIKGFLKKGLFPKRRR